MLEELNQWYSETCSFARSAHEAVEKTGSQLQDAAQFSERLLQCGITQILPVRRVALRRLHSLSSALPYMLAAMKCRSGMEFETDVSKFSAAVQASFGHFANANDSDGTVCCKTVDDSLCRSDETRSSADVGSVSLMTLSKVCASACNLCTKPWNSNSVKMLICLYNNGC